VLINTRTVRRLFAVIIKKISKSTVLGVKMRTKKTFSSKLHFHLYTRAFAMREKKWVAIASRNESHFKSVRWCSWLYNWSSESGLLDNPILASDKKQVLYIHAGVLRIRCARQRGCASSRFEKAAISHAASLRYHPGNSRFTHGIKIEFTH